MSRLRAGGWFVGIVLTAGAVNAITGFIPDSGDSEDSVAFTGSNSPVKAGTVPQKYRDLVDKWGNLCPELSPSVLAAQLSQESGWNPKAQSHAAAQGIAQFIPGTWQAYGLDANKDGRANVWDPEDAIPSAAHYDCTLAKSVRRFGGNSTDLMLASYNAGLGAVKKYGGIPPYRETQNYVRSIKAAAGNFK